MGVWGEPRRPAAGSRLCPALGGGAFILLLTGAGALAQDAGWTVEGETYLRLDQFNNVGDASLSPFVFEGFQRYLDFSLLAERVVSPANRLSIDIGGVVNQSRYRSQFEDVVPERLSAEWTYGEAAVPLRLDAGDYFANFTRRSLRRALKGGQLELQPDLGDGRMHSILLLAGSTEPSWRDFDYDAGQVTGASWLVGDTGLGAAALNVVHADIDAFLPDAAGRSQTLTSLSLAPELRAAGQRLTLDTEMSILRGDAAVIGGARGQTEQAYFAELSGAAEGSTLAYSLLYERNGEDFVPVGGFAVADREAVEAHAGYRFGNGLALSGRAFQFRDDRSGPTPRRTRSAGATLSGPLMPDTLSGATFYLDAFESRVATEGPGGERRSGALRLDVSMPVGDRWIVGVNAFYGDDVDRTTGVQNVTREIGGDLSTPVRVADWRGLLRLGLVGRTISGTRQDSDEVGFSLAVSLGRDGHAFDASLDYQSSDARNLGSRNRVRSGVGLAYSYTVGNHSFGVDGTILRRDQSPGDEVEAFRAGIFYRLSFGIGGHAGAPSVGSYPALPDADTDVGLGLTADLGAIRPGLPFDGAIQDLADSGLGMPRRQGPFAVYETQLLAGIPQRQRLVLEREDGRIERAALIVDAIAVGDGRGLGRLYLDVRDALVDRYGAPDRVIEDGAFGANPALALVEGRLIRVVEWDRPGGSVLRLGIPRRLDGILRIEVQHAASFPPPRQTLWGIEAVR